MNPLAGVRVLEYAQYVAGPFAGMLLADLGADVVKVEPPGGDAWRHYEPLSPGESRFFSALNRNKRSVVLDLKSEAGRDASRSLIAGADAVVHNLPPARAERFALDRESVRAANPRAVWCTVSALGSEGPSADVTAFDMVAQALSGLLLADARVGDAVPRRAGGIAMADFTAGLLAALSVAAGLAGAARGEAAAGVEVSLLGAALALQSQRFVSVDGVDAPRGAGPATPEDLAARAAAVHAAEELEPYYRAYRASDGFFVLTCLNEAQRSRALALLELEDAHVANPQAPAGSDAERRMRRGLVARFEARFAQRPVAEWLAALRGAGVPSAEVRSLEQLYDCEQATANGLVQTVASASNGQVRLLGNVFKVDGVATPATRGVPGLGEHTAEVLAELEAARA